MKASSKKKHRSKAKAEPPADAQSKPRRPTGTKARTKIKETRTPETQRAPVTLPPPSQDGEAPVHHPQAEAAVEQKPLPDSPAKAAAGNEALPHTGGTLVRTPYEKSRAKAQPRPPTGLIWLTIAAVISAILLVSHLNNTQWVSSERLLEQAQEALRQQNWPAALGAIKKVREDRRQEPAFQRVLADYLQETHASPKFLADTLERLKSTAEFRPEDHLSLCSALLATNQLDKARTAWDDIPASLSEGLEATRLKVGLLRMEGQLGEAARLQADLNAAFADVPLVAVRLAVAELNGPFPEVRQKATRRLWELARRRDLAGLEALRMLGRQTGRTEKEAADLLAVISKHPLASPVDRQGIVSLLLHLSPGRRAELLQAEIDHYEGEDSAALALWLAREGETQRLWQLSPELRRGQPAAWFQTVARSLAEAKQWQELMKLLQQQAELGAVSSAELLRWRAVVLMQLHPQDVAAPYAMLQHSIRQGAVEKNLACVALSAQIAEDWHMLDLALEAGLILSRPGAPNEVRMLENCHRVAMLLRDTEVLADMAARLLALQPENLLYARQDAYLRLLLGERMETLFLPEDTTRDKSAPALLVLALKAWRLNDLPHAADTLNELHDTSELTVGERAVYAGLLATVCGKVSPAYQIAEKIREEVLLEEEAVFLKRAR